MRTLPSIHGKASSMKNHSFLSLLYGIVLALAVAPPSAAVAATPQETFATPEAAADALMAGLPVVTCMGQSFPSRVAGSLLHTAGLPELATDSLEGYEALALHLARHPEKRAALRARLNDSETEQRALKQRAAERDADIAALQAKLQDNDGAVTAMLEQAQQAEAALREQLARETAERQSLEARFSARETELQGNLQRSDTELQRLRVAAAAARERIDAVLARLPGAPSGEQH